MDPYLRHRWFELCNAEGITNKMRMWEAIHSLYQEEHRAYHNLDHVADCLKKLDEWPTQVPNRNAVELALWLHDIVYDTKRTDNESTSAGLAKHYLEDHPLSEDVFELILATRHHAAQMTEAEYILCDIDLSILGSSPETYKTYSDAIKHEYSWVPEDMFLQSRIKVLQSFVEREFIYYTSHYRKKVESAARTNIYSEIEKMKNLLHKISD